MSDKHLLHIKVVRHAYIVQLQCATSSYPTCDRCLSHVLQVHVAHLGIFLSNNFLKSFLNYLGLMESVVLQMCFDKSREIDKWSLKYKMGKN